MTALKHFLPVVNGCYPEPLPPCLPIVLVPICSAKCLSKSARGKLTPSTVGGGPGICSDWPVSLPDPCEPVGSSVACFLDVLETQSYLLNFCSFPFMLSPEVMLPILIDLNIFNMLMIPNDKSLSHSSRLCK